MGFAGENIHVVMAAAFLLLLNYAGCTRAAATTCILSWLLLSCCCSVTLVAQELLTTLFSTSTWSVVCTNHMSTLEIWIMQQYCLLQCWCAQAAIRINAACKPMPGSHFCLFDAANQ